ncbi:MAG TPA: HD domain-containing protein [Acidimicrobiales bacterium]|nr:HD domain-containing protein [Acidimicrobiales bacterium]
MRTPVSTSDLFDLFEAQGHEPYGESVTQIEHALQCAALARDEHASDAMIVAALFHDVGHLVVGAHNEADFAIDEVDDDHERVGARVLAPLFGPAVAQPVSLHVTAKRWRCTREPAYYDRLSEASKLSLKAQGGLLSEEECLRFEEHPGFPDALALRTWDDEGKVVGRDVGTLDDYVGIVNSLAAAWSRGRHEQ